MTITAVESHTSLDIYGQHEADMKFEKVKENTKFYRRERDVELGKVESGGMGQFVNITECTV